MLRSVVGNAVSAAAGRIVGGVFALVAIGIVTRTLGPEQFGEYSAILAFLFLFSIAADLGLYQFLLRESSRSGTGERVLFGQALALRITALVVSLGAGAALSFLLLPLSPLARPGVIFAALMFFLQSLAQLLMAPLQKRLLVYWAAAGETLGRALQLILTMLAAARAGTTPVFLGVLAAGSLLQVGVQAGVVVKYITPSLQKPFSKTSGILRSSLPIAAGLIFTLVYFRLDTVMLSFLRSSFEVGIYNLSYKVLEYLIFFPAMFVGLVMPRLSREAVENLQGFRQTFLRLFEIVMFSALGMAAGGWFMAPLMVQALGGNDFAAAIIPLRVLLFAAIFIFAGSVLGSAAIALGQQQRTMWIYGVGMVFNFIANLALIPSFGYLAAAVTTLATEIFVALGLFLVVKRSASVPIPYRALYALPAAGFMLIPFLLSTNMRGFVLLPVAVVSAVLYFAALWFSRVFKKDHLALFTQRPQE